METTVRVIFHFEREVKSPPDDTIKKLAKALNISVERLLFPDNCNSNELRSLDKGLSK